MFVNLMFQFENLYMMAASRFLLGILSRVIAIGNFWWIYQTAMPRQKSRIVSIPLLFCAGFNLLMYMVSLKDNGGKIFWRCIASFPIALAAIILVLDIVFVKRMNSLKYLIESQGVDKAKEVAYLIYEKRTADEMCDDFNKILNPEGEVKTGKKTFL